MSYLVLFCSCVFRPFSIAITSIGKERANLCVFLTFVQFVLVWFCPFPLPLGVWEGLRFVIVAFLGLFSYLFFPLDMPQPSSIAQLLERVTAYLGVTSSNPSLAT